MLEGEDGRDLGPVKGDDWKMGRSVQLTRGVAQQCGGEYRSMVSTQDQAIGDETVGGEFLSDRKNLPRGAWDKMLEEDVGRVLEPVKTDDGNMGSGLDLTTEVSLASPILHQQEQAESDGTVGDELLSDKEGILARDLQDVPVLLPMDVVLILFKFMKPGDILKASQTCQLWRFVGENDKLWEQKCKEAGFAYLTVANKKALERRNENSTITYSAWKFNFLKVVTIEMIHGVNKMEFFNDKIITSFGTNLYVFCAMSGNLLHTLIGHTGYVSEFQMDDLFVVSSSHDGSVKVWDVDTGTCLHTMLSHTGGVTFLQMHGNIAVSASSGTYNTLWVWDVRDGRCLITIRNYNDSARRYNGRVQDHYMRMSEGYIDASHVLFDGKFVVSGSEEDRTIKIWDPETGECLRTLYHSSIVVFLKLNGVDVVAGYDDGSIKVWEVNTGVCRRTLRINCSQYMEMQGDMLVCVGDDRTTAKIWNMSTGSCLPTLNEHRRAITGIGVNGKLAVTSSRDGTVKLWDIKTGKFIRDILVLESGGTVEKMKMQDAKIICVVKSNEGSKLLVLNFDSNDSD